MTVLDLDRQTAVLAFANASGHPDVHPFLQEAVTRLLERASKA
ncbi:hypothetical protein [Stigmatella aurantiaca]|nr:hypothetical protein [Stigmatella aurantiaca]